LRLGWRGMTKPPRRCAEPRAAELRPNRDIPFTHPAADAGSCPAKRPSGLRHWWTVLAVLVWPWTGAAEQPSVAPALLRATIVDAVSGAPTACTVSLVDAQGKLATERESFKTGFRCDGRFEKFLPAGPTVLRVTRGLETRAVERKLDLAPGSTNQVRLSLERTTDLRSRGWFAGDSHVHMIHGEQTIPVDFDFVALTARAEDLQYLSLGHAWQLENPTPERLGAELAARSTATTVLTWNVEAPKNYYKGDAGRCLGHCWSVSTSGRTAKGDDVIQMLLAASAADYESSKPSFANFESHRLIHAQGGTVFYSHPARWWMGAWGGQGGYPKVEKMRVSNLAVELPLDTLLGPTYDGLDIITGAGEWGANASAFELWAMLLNHGYRVAATASSDACFDRPGGAVPGAARTYTFLKTPFSLSAVAQAMAQGKTFVTTGPLLLATIQGEPPGTSFPADGQVHQLALEAWANGSDAGGLRRLEILRNGKVIWTHQAAAPAPFCATNVSVRELEAAWYCARAFGSDPQRQRAITGAFFFDPPARERPAPVAAQVHARIVDSATGQLIPGTLTELTFSGTLAQEGPKHTLTAGESQVVLPGISRLRAEAPGYASLTLSPFLDNAPLLEFITRLEEKELLDWQTFERVRGMLADVRLTFALEKKRP
jgi:hypothetical protein